MSCLGKWKTVSWVLSVKKPVRIFKASRSQCVTECKAYALNKKRKKSLKERRKKDSHATQLRQNQKGKKGI